MDEELRGQKSALASIMVSLNSKYGGALLAMSPGDGKTIVGLKAASLLGKSTLVIVHKNFLLNQWKERIESCLPNARIGIIQGEIADIEDKDIVICMVQSIIREGKYEDNFFDRFGFVIIDEAHRKQFLLIT
jgi:superfamily II DNA or RNA helicase